MTATGPGAGPASPAPATADGGPPEAEERRTRDVGDRLVTQATRKRRRRSVTVHAVRVLFLVLVLGVWELGAQQGWINTLYFSRPSAIVSFTIDQRVVLYSDARATLYAALMAFLIGTSSGIVGGIILAQFDFANRVLEPIFMVLASMPRIALAPLFIVIFGISPDAKIALGVSLVFFIIFFNTRAAVRGTDPDLLMLARTLRMGRFRTLTKISLPWAVPSMLASMRLCIIYSLLAVVASEMIASRNGLGLAIIRASQNLNTAGIFAPILILALAATSLNLLVQRLERKLLVWQAPDR